VENEPEIGTEDRERLEAERRIEELTETQRWVAGEIAETQRLLAEKVARSHAAAQRLAETRAGHDAAMRLFNQGQYEKGIPWLLAVTERAPDPTA
jgi:hypothetical protein